MSQALWHISPTASELRAVTPPTSEDLVAVQSCFSMVSTGTERLVALGRAASSGAALDAPYAEGDYGFPIKYGYSLVGYDASGKPVHCLHPHQSVAYVRQSDVFGLPETLSLRRAALLSNMETVLTAIWDASLTDGSDVLVCGFGNIGALLANTLRLQNGINAVVVETNGWRRTQAQSLGFDALAPDDADGPYTHIFHTSCTATGLEFCIDHAATDGTVIELSWYGVAAIPVHLGGAFHRNRVTIRSSQVATIPPALQAMVTAESRKRIAVELLGDESFDALVTNELDFAESPAFFDRLRDGRQGDGLIWVIRY